MTAHRTRRVATSLFGVAIGLAAMAAAAEDAAPVKLFKMITSKDEVVIGLTNDELRSFGPKPDVENLADHLISAGQITAWQYAVKKTPDGTSVEAPLRRIAVLKSDTLRIEPYNAAPLKVLPPDAAQ